MKVLFCVISAVLLMCLLDQTKGTYNTKYNDWNNYWDRIRDKYRGYYKDNNNDSRDRSRYRDYHSSRSERNRYTNKYTQYHENRDIVKHNDPRDIRWNEMKQNDWYATWSKLAAWKKDVQKTQYNSQAASCPQGQLLQCWSCQNENEKDCQPNQHGNQWQTCQAGESCYTEYNRVYVGQSYKGPLYATKVSRGCMKLSTCKLKPCRDCWARDNCRDCGGRCWSRCQHPKCPRPVQCKRCDNVKCKEDCYASNNYETCNQQDAVCIERWSCVRDVGATFSSGCSDRVTCYQQKDATDKYNKVGLVECKDAICPTKPEPTTEPPTEPTTKPTTDLPCPGPGEDTIDFDDKKKLTMAILGPETVEERNPLAFLRGFKKSKPLFLVMQGTEENTVRMNFKDDRTYNIVKLDFETSKADWIQADLYNGNTLQHSVKAFPTDPSAKWSPSSVDVTPEKGKGITKIVFSFGFQTGELQARGSFLTVCP